MSDLLQWIPFTSAHLPEVGGFNCCTESWSRAASAWIAATSKERGAIQSIKKYKNSVWLYYTPTRELVGFGSLGTTKWDWPFGSGKKSFSYIPQLAIAKPFQGKAVGGVKYSHQIISDLIRKARGHDTEFIALHVHSKNSTAIKLYERFGFSVIDEVDDETEEMVRMVRRNDRQ